MVGSSIQISTLPLIILSPLQALGLVFNLICGAVILGEVFTVHTVRGTLFVSVGAFFIAFFGSIPEPNHKLNELLMLLRRPAFLAWFSVLVGVLLAVLLYISYLNYLRFRVIEATSDSSCETDPLLPPKIGLLEPQNPPFVQGILFGIVCGILSAHALLLAKSAVGLVINAVIDRTLEDLWSYQAWLIIGGWVFCAVMQVYYLNLGLKIISSLIIFPLIFCVYNMTNILNGLIYFDQFNKLSLLEIGFIFTGVCLILFGVFYLSINEIMTNNVLAEECLEATMHPETRSPLLSFALCPDLPRAISHSLTINTQAAQGKPLRPRTFVNTPSLTVSRTHSVMTNSSMNPILSESFEADKLADGEI